MKKLISRFAIDNLFGAFNVDINFDSNHLILVGENGTGKSTIVSALYFLLTSQWTRLAEYHFNKIEIVISGERLEFSHDQIETLSHLHKRRRNSLGLPPHIVYQIQKEVEILARKKISFEEVVNRLQDKYGIPTHMLVEFISRESDLFGDESSDITKTEVRIKDIFQTPILFLPTYRRIERDLAAIFGTSSDPEENIQKYRNRLRYRSKGTNYVELVEFGMEDVEGMVKDTMSGLNDALRKSLDTLTGEYLREVLRREYEEVDLGAIRSVKESTIDSMLNRIDEKILPKPDQNTLRETINTIAAKENVGMAERVAAHFTTKLLKLHQSQAEREQSVRSFISICNEYLIGKRLSFDNTKFTLSVVLSNGSNSDNGNTIEFKSLSSGEKQIVSLFAHLLLSTENQFFVIIDEPELSLSVPWQKRFLPDILNTGKCNELVAVTHSPFIFQNELEGAAHSIQEYKTELA